jgi:hypothetical protein
VTQSPSTPWSLPDEPAYAAAPPPQYTVSPYGPPQHAASPYAPPANGGWGFAAPATVPYAPRLQGGRDTLTWTAIVLGGLYCALRWLWALPTSDEPATPESSGAYLAGAVFGLLAIVGVVVGLYVVAALWLQRARADAAALEPFAQPHGPAWVWFGVFVPVACLFIPLRIVRAARATLLRRAGMTAGGALVNGWWAAWVGSLIASSAAHTSDSDAFGLVSALLFTIAFGLWIQIVLQMSDAQERGHHPFRS